MATHENEGKSRVAPLTFGCQFESIHPGHCQIPKDTIELIGRSTEQDQRIQWTGVNGGSIAKVLNQALPVLGCEGVPRNQQDVSVLLFQRHALVLVLRR